MGAIELKFRIVDADGKKAITSVRTFGKAIDFPQGVQAIDLAPLGKLPLLEKIILQTSMLRNVDLSPLSVCRKLVSLEMKGNKLQNIDLSPLSKCKHLHYLNLSSNPLQALDLTPLAGSELRYLHLFHVELRELDITPLYSCNELKGLYISPEIRLLAHSSWETKNDTPEALEQKYGQIEWVTDPDEIKLSLAQSKDDDLDDDWPTIEPKPAKDRKEEIKLKPADEHKEEIDPHPLKEREVIIRERVLVICPFCSTKVDLGTSSCSNCGGKL